MSFASIQSQQFGVTSVYAFSSTYNQAGYDTILSEILPEGKYIYLFNAYIHTSNQLEESIVRINDGTIETNLWKYDVQSQSHFVNMSGIWESTGLNTLYVQLYQSTQTVNSTVNRSGTLTCLKIV